VVIAGRDFKPADTPVTLVMAAPVVVAAGMVVVALAPIVTIAPGGGKGAPLVAAATAAKRRLGTPGRRRQGVFIPK